jgi:hypothetical protein
MAEMDIGFGILVETKITAGIYTCFLSRYNMFMSNAVSIQQGGLLSSESQTNSMRSRNSGRADQMLSPLWWYQEASVTTLWDVISHQPI